MDVDAAPEVAERYTYTALPHILFIRNGQIEAQLSNPTAQIIEAHILALFQLDAWRKKILESEQYMWAHFVDTENILLQRHKL